jgi:hypothetical protein
MLAVALLAVTTARAHGPVERVSEARPTAARLFTADAATGEVVALDLPSGETVARLTTPPFVMQLGLSADGMHVFATRGRDTDRDWVTIIDSGLSRDDDTARPPFVARTMLGAAPGGIRRNVMSTVGGHDALFMEGTARIIVLEGGQYAGLDAIPNRQIELAAPDHYHYLEAGEQLYVGHLRRGFLQIIDRTSGREVGRIENCPGLHGMAKDRVNQRLLFACRQDMIVVGTRGEERDQLVARVGYPTGQRAAAFLAARDGVLWAYTEGELPRLYRLDTATLPYSFDVLPVSSAVQQNVSRDGRLLLVLSRTGVLEIRDGAFGDLLRSVRVTEPFPAGFHEHVDKAVLPDIEELNGLAYVTVPNEGRIAVVDLDAGQLRQHIDVGGEPTRLVLIEREAGARLAGTRARQ